MSVGELACTYAALVLHDDGIAITVIHRFTLNRICVFFLFLWGGDRLLISDLIFVFVQAEKISALLKAANLSVESYWPSLFAKLCEKKNVEDLIVNVGAGGGGGAVAVAAPAGGATGGAASAAPAVEEKKVRVLVSD